MRLVVDIETNALENPTQVWLIVCYDIDTEEYHVFREPTTNQTERDRFRKLAENVKTWIGHNWLGFDYPILSSLVGLSCNDVGVQSVDTLIISKLVDYSRDGHSIESYGLEFGIEKGKFDDWTKYSEEMEKYCIRDVEICTKIYRKYHRIISNPFWRDAILLENRFQLIVNSLSTNGFSFNSEKADSLLNRVLDELKILDEAILREFPPRLKMVAEVHPKETKHGTLNRSNFRWYGSPDLSDFNGGSFCRCALEPFNPASTRQVVDVLNTAGWQPTDKTKAHTEIEREINQSRYKDKQKALDLIQSERYTELKKFGYKINEINLATLPKTAPSSAKTLAKRILLESRRRTLTEWLALVLPDGRIRGRFYGIGAWTQRMAHQSPNTANIPSVENLDGTIKLYGGEMRALWRAPKKRLLVGVDAEGIQLRIFAHYINDPEFTDALVRGDKNAKTDPHSLNQRILGRVCRTRQAAKRFIYALLLGAGLGKLGQILECSQEETKSALERLIKRYQGFAELKEKVIPMDAKRGWFVGLDGRRVLLPGETSGMRKHLCMSGYLQNGEQIIIKKVAVQAMEKINRQYLTC